MLSVVSWYAEPTVGGAMATLLLLRSGSAELHTVEAFVGEGKVTVVRAHLDTDEAREAVEEVAEDILLSLPTPEHVEFTDAYGRTWEVLPGRPEKFVLTLDNDDEEN